MVQFCGVGVSLLLLFRLSQQQVRKHWHSWKRVPDPTLPLLAAWASPAPTPTLT